MSAHSASRKGVAALVSLARNVRLHCPYPLAENPHAAEAAASNAAFIRRHMPDLGGKHGAFESFAQGVSWAFPGAPLSGLSLLADWASLFFFIDDACAGQDSLGALCELNQAVLSTLAGRGARLQTPLLRALADFSERFTASSTPEQRARFRDAVDDFLAACAWEAQNRALARVPSMREYQRQRVYSGATFTFFELLDQVSGPIREASHRDPLFRAALTAANRTTCHANDLFSYAKEASAGDVHNLIALFMHESGMSLAEAQRAAVDAHDMEMHRYEAFKQQALARTIDPALPGRFCAVDSVLSGHLAFVRTSERYR
jgi:hypothetical protein